MGGYDKTYSVRNPITVTGGGEPNLTSQTITVTQNGYQTWNASNYGNYDGFSSVQFLIDVHSEKDLSRYNLIDKTFNNSNYNGNHWYYAYDDNCDGYKSVTIDISFQTINVVQDISYNGTNKTYYYYNYENGRDYIGTFTANVNIQPYIGCKDGWSYATYSGNKILSIPNRSTVQIWYHEGFKIIGRYAAYNNDRLETFYPIEDSIEIDTIEESAFENCINLRTIYLKSALRRIGNNAFKNTKISTIYYSGSTSDWENNITFGSDWITTTDTDLTTYSVYCNNGTLTYNY